MKKILLLALMIILSVMPVFAGTQKDALAFFNKYTTAANNYDNHLIDYYSPNAVIIRVVVRPDGTKGTAVFQMKDYANQLKLGAMTAKIRNYKNYYSDVKVTKVPLGYKVSALRRPTGENYKLQSYFVVSDKTGTWKIVEEMMETKVQVFNNYVGKRN